MRLAVTALSILAVVLALPLLAETPSPSASSASAPAAAGAGPTGDTTGELAPAAPTAPLDAKKKGETCASENAFLIELLNQDCSGCTQACQDAGGTFVTGLFDRVNCLCICCAA